MLKNRELACDIFDQIIDASYYNNFSRENRKLFYFSRLVMRGVEVMIGNAYCSVIGEIYDFEDYGIDDARKLKEAITEILEEEVGLMGLLHHMDDGYPEVDISFYTTEKDRSHLPWNVRNL